MSEHETAGYKRLTINVAEPLADELQELADQQGIELPELFRRAVAVYKLLPAQRPVVSLRREFRNGVVGGVAFGSGIAILVYGFEAVSWLVGLAL